MFPVFEKTVKLINMRFQHSSRLYRVSSVLTQDLVQVSLLKIAEVIVLKTWQVKRDFGIFPECFLIKYLKARYAKNRTLMEIRMPLNEVGNRMIVSSNSVAFEKSFHGNRLTWVSLLFCNKLYNVHYPLFHNDWKQHKEKSVHFYVQCRTGNLTYPKFGWQESQRMFVVCDTIHHW